MTKRTLKGRVHLAGGVGPTLGDRTQGAMLGRGWFSRHCSYAFFFWSHCLIFKINVRPGQGTPVGSRQLAFPVPEASGGSAAERCHHVPRSAPASTRSTSESRPGPLRARRQEMARRHRPRTPWRPRSKETLQVKCPAKRRPLLSVEPGMPGGSLDPRARLGLRPAAASSSLRVSHASAS